MLLPFIHEHPRAGMRKSGLPNININRTGRCKMKPDCCFLLWPPLEWLPQRQQPASFFATHEGNDWNHFRDTISPGYLLSLARTFSSRSSLNLPENHYLRRDHQQCIFRVCALCPSEHFYTLECSLIREAKLSLPLHLLSLWLSN